MLKVAHRINTKEQLLLVPTNFGVELDLRPDGKEIILQHDPFLEGEKFEDWLKFYYHNLLILNTKAEGMEDRLIKLLKQRGIENYFFLDLSLPYLIKYMNLGLRNIAVRFSEYEPIEFVMNFVDKVDWIWVDCFKELPLNFENYSILKKHFKLCLVSPELQGYPIHRIEEFKTKLIGMEIDAVCTKRPDLW